MKQLNKYILRFLLFYITFSMSCFSQKFELTVSESDSGNLEILNQLKFKKNMLSLNEIHVEIDQLKKQLYNLGYLESKIDTVIKSKTKFHIFFTKNKLYKTIQINISNELQIREFLSTKNIAILNNKINLKFSNISFFLTSLIKYYENIGYPFSKVHLSNIKLKKEHAIATLNIKRNSIRRIDKIITNGYPEFPKSFSKNKINPFKKKLLNTQKLNRISNAIKTITFVEQTKKPAVLFKNDSTLIYIYLKKKSQNSFNGLIGFSSNKNGKGVTLNGNIHLNLSNIFNYGEQFKLKWSSISSQNKALDIHLIIPYVFKTKFNTKTSFSVFNNNDKFFNLNSKLEISYIFNDFHELIANTSFKKSTSLSKDTLQNNIVDFNNQFYGISYKKTSKPKESYNNFKNTLEFGAYLGSRFSSEKIIQNKFYLKGAYLFPLTAKNSIFIKNSSGFLKSSNYIENELFRIGGTKSIRGFQDESIYTSAHSIWNLEYRYATNKTSYLYSVSDYAFVRNKLSKNASNLFGLGFGYSFKSRIGDINLSYVLGKTDNTPFNLKNNAIHIKLITFF